jgi:hypothetical protein
MVKPDASRYYQLSSTDLVLCAELVVRRSATTKAVLSTTQWISIVLYRGVRLGWIEVCTIQRHGQCGEGGL